MLTATTTGQMLPPFTQHDEFLARMASHQRPLLKVCWAYGGGPHDRDDLMQEIVARLWSAFGAYDRSRSFMTWMYRIALNVAIDHQRRQRRWGRKKVRLADDDADSMTASGRDPPSSQMSELHDLLDQQPEADRAILLLCLEDRSYREIGEILGISESNVGTRLGRLKKSLRQADQPPVDEERNVK